MKMGCLNRNYYFVVFLGFSLLGICNSCAGEEVTVTRVDVTCERFDEMLESATESRSEKLWIGFRGEVKRKDHSIMNLSGKLSVQGASNLWVSPKKNFRVKLKVKKGSDAGGMLIRGNQAAKVVREFILRTPTQDSWLDNRLSNRQQARYVTDLWMCETLREMGYPTQVHECIYIAHLYCQTICRESPWFGGSAI